MNPKNSLLLVGALALSGLAALAIFGGPKHEPAVPDTVPVRPEVEPRDEPSTSEDIVTQPDLKSDPAARPRPRHVPPPGATSGMISGRIAVATSLIDRLSSYTIVVEEDVNPNARQPEGPAPFRKSFPFTAGRGTPYFDIEGIPFSRHPYRVTVVARGMNGSTGFAHVSAESPAGSEEVRLSLTPGVYFSVMVRDQRRNPRPGLAVHLLPIDRTLNDRTPMRANTSELGQAVFEGVLHGEWEIRVGEVNAPLAEPHRVQVLASFTARDLATGKPRAQGAEILVPDGHNVTVQVTNRYGYLLQDVDVKLQQIEVQRLFEYTGKTDAAGRCVFENIPYGKYQASVWKSGNGRADKRLAVERDKPAPVLKVELPK